MIAYVINFVLCSGLLLLVYRVFLANENLYRFNRFYLLLSLVFSLAIPFVTIKVPSVKISWFHEQAIKPMVTPVVVKPVEPQTDQIVFEAPVKQQRMAVIVNNNDVQQSNIPQAAPVIVSKPVKMAAQAPAHNYLPDVLLALYTIAALIMLARFAHNGWRISRLVAKNTIVNYEDTSLVLVDEMVTPHSFLKYVFINKDDYQSGAIEPEIICHEQAHIKQLHSLDVLFVELLQVVCWFNPFIPFYRRAMQLNHEFLADEEVIKNYHDTPAYQYLLLAKASQSGSMYLTSQFNYQVTKKRIIMMTKNTSAATAWIARLAVIPVITIAFLLFCNKTVAALKTISVKKTEKPVKVNVVSKDTSIKKARQEWVRFPINYPHTQKGASVAVLKEYAAVTAQYSHDRAYDNLEQKIPTLLPADRARLEQLFAQMSSKQQNAQKLGFTIYQYKLTKPTQELFDEWQAKKYKIYIDGKRFTAAELAKHQPDEFYHYGVGREYFHNSSKYIWSVGLMTKATFNKFNKQMEGSRIVYNYKLPDGTVRQYTGYGKNDAPKEAAIKQGNVQHADAEKTNATKQESPNVITMVGRQTIPVVAQRDTKVIPPAKYDAPQEVLDEYLAILKKYNLPPGPEQVNFTTSKTDHLRLEDLFNKMSKKQQDMQVIKFGPLLLPASKRAVTAQQLVLWQDVATYRVWIDGKKIDQSELAKHQPSEFDYYDAGRLAKTNPNYKKYRAEIYLMTPAYFKKDRERTIADRNQVMFYRAPKKDKALSFVKEDSKPVVASKSGAPKGIKIRGEVVYPGDYVLQKNNVLESLKAAGGIKPSGSIANVQVFRGGTRLNIDFASANSKDILLPGDSVYVARIH